MDVTKVKSLMQQFEDSNVRELKIDEGNFHLYLSKNETNTVKPSGAAPTPTPVATQKQTQQPQVKKNNSSISSTASENKKPVEKATPVKAPLVGIVYLQAKPGKPPYVKVGEHVNKGDTICIIEAMKMMTEVKSTVSGTVKEIKVENEDLVEVDQPLITVKED